MPSTFTLEGNTATFEVASMTERAGPVGEIHAVLRIGSEAEWRRLSTMVTWRVSVTPIPGGSKVVVDIGSGAGAGDLDIEGTGSQRALLKELSRGMPDRTTGESMANATFLLLGEH